MEKSMKHFQDLKLLTSQFGVVVKGLQHNIRYRCKESSSKMQLCKHIFADSFSQQSVTLYYHHGSNKDYWKKRGCNCGS
ncbi:unnamed protein product [Timema podura]|uniref:SWIM-type domain-containing protein n=1 Tax=Timema podura TaxID=61482 RepID=A0ABN7NEY1_TIMPD|nr:unnamed protein product [Timema podura]